MSGTHSPNLLRGAIALCAVSALAGTAVAQTVPATPPPPAQTQPNAVTPPGGIARGVVPPPTGLDPGMIEPPPTNVKPTMPVIKPPGTSR